MGSSERVDAGLPAVDNGHVVSFGLENAQQRLSEQRIVIDHEQALLCRVDDHARRDFRLSGLLRRRRKSDSERRPLPDRAIDLDLRAMTLGHAVDHGEPHARPALPLRREERLDAPSFRLLVHAGPGIRNLEHDAMRIAVRGSRVEGQSAARGHRIDGIEDKIRQCVADVALRAHDSRQLRRQVCPHFDDDAPLLRHVAPAHARQCERLADEAVQVHGLELRALIALPVKLAHARDRLSDVRNRALNRAQVLARPRAQVRLALEQGFRVERDRRDGVVDVVRDAARHLSERAQTLLLQQRLLALPQVVVGIL